MATNVGKCIIQRVMVSFHNTEWIPGHVGAFRVQWSCVDCVIIEDWHDAHRHVIFFVIVVQAYHIPLRREHACLLVGFSSGDLNVTWGGVRKEKRCKSIQFHKLAPYFHMVTHGGTCIFRFRRCDFISAKSISGLSELLGMSALSYPWPNLTAKA